MGSVTVVRGDGFDDPELVENHHMSIVSTAATRHACTVRVDRRGARRGGMCKGVRAKHLQKHACPYLDAPLLSRLLWSPRILWFALYDDRESVASVSVSFSI